MKEFPYKVMTHEKLVYVGKAGVVLLTNSNIWGGGVHRQFGGV